ncbi:MAG: adenylate/guanylate cyclase domain-containing protein [Leptospiraceae bacterium]|nr:adenylate/guanylate cyclase domain-containing protein [Leptospiraceae bacterium]
MSQEKKFTVLDIVFIVLATLGTLSILVMAFFNDLAISFLASLLGIFLLLISSYFIYKVIEKITSKNRQKFGSLWIAFLFSMTFFSLQSNFETILRISELIKLSESSVATIITEILSYPITFPINLEEQSISWRFSRRGNQSEIEHESESGKIAYFQYNPPPNARPDIQIIGVTTETLEKLQEEWPINWAYYAKIIDNFNQSKGNTLFFDIFMLDYKPKETEILRKSVANSDNAIFDYPMETKIKLKESIQNLDKRLAALSKYKLQNVIDPDDQGIAWLRFAVPPITQIGSVSAGMGFANIKKIGNFATRKMPLVAKLYEHGSNGETEYYPSIGYIAICKYYGVDVVKDTEVKMGEYIKIKNIPQKTIKIFNPKTFKTEEKDIMHKPNPKREITIPIDLYGQMDINFVGGWSSFKYHEFFEVATEWDKEVASQFENSIFLVAMYYATGRSAPKDLHASPYGEMSGIEFHAHSLNTVLNQDFVAYSSVLLNFLFFVGFALLLGYFTSILKTQFSSITFILMIIAYSFFALYTFESFNFVTPLPTVVIMGISVFFTITAFKVITEEAHVKYIKTTFSKFVSKDIVDELLKDPEKIALGGSKKEITIFFSDVRGFTTISESLSPEELVKLLNEYLSAMTEIIIELKGTIDKYMGDAIMAFWGAPVPLEDHAYYACVASLAQFNYLKELQKGWREKNLPVIDIGIGLNTGYAIVGNMGSSHRMEYTCMGDTINLGSRLEGSNKTYGTNITISEYTYEKVKDRIYARELDLVKVKGKNLPVRIYELIGLVNDKDMDLLKKPIQKG